MSKEQKLQDLMSALVDLTTKNAVLANSVSFAGISSGTGVGLTEGKDKPGLKAGAATTALVSSSLFGLPCTTPDSDTPWWRSAK